MNNPFTSNRSLFDNLPKHQKTQPPLTSQQEQKNIQIQNAKNQMTNQFSATSGNANFGSNLNAKSNNLGSNMKSYSPANVADPKADLNFRSEFRTTEPPKKPYSNNFMVNFDDSSSNMTSSNQNYSTANLQNHVISDKQYPPASFSNQNKNYSSNSGYGNQNFQQNSKMQDSIPSLTIPNASSISGFSGGYASKSNYQGAGIGLTNNSGTGGNFNSGIQRQKITFGVASGNDNTEKIQFDRNKFVNRAEFVAASGYSIGSSSTNNQHQFQSQPPTSSGNKNMSHLNMSPIQQHSKHMMQQAPSNFLDIDAMGDDIQKILASSKNQQQLFRLLGIDTKNNQSPPQSFAKQTSYHRSVSDPQADPYPSSSPGLNTFTRKTSLPQPNPTYPSYAPQSPKQPDYVFNYESDPVQPQSQQGQSNSLSNSHLNPNANQGNNRNGYSSQLQLAIDQEMKKLSINGRNRVFLSAGQRIQTVKYNMQYI